MLVLPLLTLAKILLIATAAIIDKEVQERPFRPLLLPPEIILGAYWDETADIWTVGCLVRVPILLFAVCLNDLTFIYISVFLGL